MFLKNYFLKEKIKQNSYFIWNSQKKYVQTIKHFKPLDLKLIIGVDNQKETLLKNTIKCAEGNFTNNALLWGARGNGKSSLIKSVYKKNKNNELKKAKNQKYYFRKGKFLLKIGNYSESFHIK